MAEAVWLLTLTVTIYVYLFIYIKFIAEFVFYVVLLVQDYEFNWYKVKSNLAIMQENTLRKTMKQ